MAVTKIFFVMLVFYFAATVKNNCVAQSSQKLTENYKGRFFLTGKISLDSLTKYVHKNSGIRFSFNSVKVKGSKEIIFTKADYSLSEILHQIKKTTSLYYTHYSGYIIFQDNPPKQIQKPDLSKQNSSAKIKASANDNYKTKSKTIKNQNQIIEKQNNVSNAGLHKDTAKQKSANVINTTPNLPKQDSIINNKNNSQNSSAKIDNKNLPDSIKTNPAPKNKIEKPVNSGSSLNDTVKTNLNSKAKVIRNKINLGLHYGVQWNVALPLYGFKEYFTGTNGKNQFYNLFIPGLWISKSVGKKNNELLLELKPEQQYFTGNKIIQISKTPIDSLNQKNTVVIKTNTIYAGLQYNYQITEKWNIGIGINYNWQIAALANKQTIRGSDGALLSDSLYGINKSSPEWQYLKTTFITGKFEFLYNINKLQVGAAIAVPLTSFFTTPLNSARSVNGNIFLRWRIK